MHKIAFKEHTAFPNFPKPLGWILRKGNQWGKKEGEKKSKK